MDKKHLEVQNTFKQIVSDKLNLTQVEGPVYLP